MTSLFIPSEEKFIAIQNVVKSKFAFIDTIKTTINAIENMYNNMNISPSMSIDIPENRTGITSVEVINLSWYAPFKPYGDLIITAFTYLFFIWRLYLRVPSILHGTSGVVDKGISIIKN